MLLEETHKLQKKILKGMTLENKKHTHKTENSLSVKFSGPS